MKWTERITKFQPALLELFGKMILGVNVELSDKGRKEHPHLTGKWFFITKINSDESIEVCSSTHTMHDGLNYTHIKFK